MAVAAVVVLSGCAAAGGDSDVRVDPSTSQVIVESQADPWELPLEERPELFDPCAEIPVEAVEEGVGSPVRPDDELRINRPGELFACGWKNEEVLFGVLSTWKSRGDYLRDESFVASESEVLGRPGLRLLSKADMGDNSCRQLFFSSEGTLFVSVDLIHGLASFKGQVFANSCSVLDEAIVPVVQHLPDGDF